MELFRGIVVVNSIPKELEPNVWNFDILFKSSERFLITDIKINDIVFFNCYDKNTDTGKFERFIVTDIKDTTDKYIRNITIKLDREFSQTETKFVPYIGEDYKSGLIGRKTKEYGFTPLPSLADGANESDIVRARNIDFEYRDKELMKTLKEELVKFTKNEILTTEWKPNTKYIENKLLIYNGLLLKSKNEHTTDSTIDFSNYDVLNIIQRYNDSKEYIVNTIVNHNGDLYIALKNIPTNTQIANKEYWKKLSNEPLTIWKNNVEYNINDIIVYEDNIYRAKNITKKASFDLTDWILLTRSEKTNIPIWQNNKNY